MFQFYIVHFSLKPPDMVAVEDWYRFSILRTYSTGSLEAEWILRLQRPLKIFLELKSICLRYLEGAPGSGLLNAPTLMSIEHIHQLES